MQFHDLIKDIHQLLLKWMEQEETEIWIKNIWKIRET